MKSGKGYQVDEEEEEDDEFGNRKDANPSTNNTRDGKKSDKTNATRSKHSVTEQRRRCKINERYQILRDLIPNSDQKRDTASFLSEVIQYVQFLHEKVEKYEGSYQPWSSEPTKLMPWRNSHWRVQSFAGQAQTMKNGSGSGSGPGPGSTFPGRFDETNAAVPTTMQPVQHNPIDHDPMRNASCRSMDSQNELPNKAMAMPMGPQASMPVHIPNDGSFSHTFSGQTSDAQSSECPMDEPTIEGGTISISSVYSHELLNSLAQALQNTGVDLSQATISVQVNLGKRANRGSTTPGISIPKDHGIPIPSGSQPVGPFQDSSNSENLDQAHK
ncbi:hypothetical protein RD792_015383, partial [Penstemon davidsonii]